MLLRWVSMSTVSLVMPIDLGEICSIGMFALTAAATGVLGNSAYAVAKNMGKTIIGTVQRIARARGRLAEPQQAEQDLIRLDTPTSSVQMYLDKGAGLSQESVESLVRRIRRCQKTRRPD